MPFSISGGSDGAATTGGGAPGLVVDEQPERASASAVAIPTTGNFTGRLRLYFIVLIPSMAFAGPFMARPWPKYTRPRTLLSRVASVPQIRGHRGRRDLSLPKGSPQPPVRIQ